MIGAAIQTGETLKNLPKPELVKPPGSNIQKLEVGTRFPVDKPKIINAQTRFAELGTQARPSDVPTETAPQTPTEQPNTAETVTLQQTEAVPTQPNVEAQPAQPTKTPELDGKKETLQQRLEELKAKGQLTKEQAQQLAQQHILANGNKEDFLALADQYPDIVEAVDQALAPVADLQEAVKNAQDIDSKEVIVDGNDKKIEMVMNKGTSQEKKITVNQLALVGCFLLADTLFNGGRNVNWLCESIMGNVVRNGFNDYFKNLGFETPSIYEKNTMYQKLLGGMDKERLKMFLGNLKGKELYYFLESMSEADRKNMLNLRPFGTGGFLGGGHTITQEQRDSILTKLSETDKLNLRLLDVAPTAAPDATQPVAAAAA